MKGLKKALACAVVSVLATAAQADITRFEMGVSAWATEFDGGFTVPLKAVGFPGDYTVDSKNFDFETQGSATFFIRTEHDNKYWPNLYIAYSSIEHSAPGEFSYDVTQLSAKEGYIDLSHFDISLYYEIPTHPQLDLNLGLTARAYFGEFQLNRFVQVGATNPTEQSIASSLERELAMIYLDFHYWPIDRLDLYLNSQWGELDDQKAQDYTLGLQYTFKNGVGIGGGYRSSGFEVTAEITNIKDTEINSDMKVQGAFLSLFYSYQ